ncbi:MAG: FAD binding domain-containing protein, partial [Anaerolineae bacterium]|nr:FAD binding domain-containing protein [Anaerolineae bacterium]
MHRFDYVAPRSLDETLATLNHWGADARLLAGGTDLLVQMKEGRRTPRCVVSLHHLPGIAGIRAEDGGLWIGARTTMAEVSEHLMAGAVLPGYLGLAEGAGLVGSIQIRNLATVGGNLCNAAPSADVAPPLMTLGARAIIAGPGGQKSMSLEDFFRGPGQTALEPTQLLLGVRVPAPVARSGSAYLRHTPRAWMD